MRAGELNKRIIIEENTPTKDATTGEFVDTWTPWRTVWAAIEPLSGNRYWQAKQANAEVDGVVRIRYRAGVKPTMRIKFGERYLYIKSIIQPKEAKEQLHLLYTEALD